MPARDHGESGVVCDFERSFGRRCKLWVICVRRCKLWVIVSREVYSRLGAHVKDGAQTACRHNLIFYTLVVCISTLPSVRRHCVLSSHYVLPMSCKNRFSQWFGEYVCELMFCRGGLDDNLISLYMLPKMMIGLVYVLGSWANLGKSSQF